MKIESIKTKKHFYDFADVWYQRTHRLREAWHDENRSLQKRIQARILYFEMVKRVMKLHKIAIQLTITKPSKNSKSGLTWVNNDYDKEPIIKK